MQLHISILISCMLCIISSSNAFLQQASRLVSVYNNGRRDNHWSQIRNKDRQSRIYASNTSGGEVTTIQTAIAGAGPSGLLLAHFLLSQNSHSAIKYKVTLFESRSDPRLLSANALDERAYALGIGIRGRSAMETVGSSLWEQVKQRGFQSDKFQMYFNPTTKITLRDDKKDNQWKDEADKNEPSLLIYQTDLCSSLLDELKHYSKDDLDIFFNSKIVNVDLTN